MPGRQLLSLCGESNQRRTKEREENRSGGFLLSPWISSHLSTDRGTPPGAARRATRGGKFADATGASGGCLVQCCATQFPRRGHRLIHHTTPRENKPYATIAVSPRAQPGGVPRPAEKMMDSKGRRKTARKGCPSSFGAPLPTFAVRTHA